MAIDISKLSLSELLMLQKDLALEVPRRMVAERNKVIADLKQMAADRGFDLNDLLGSKGAKSKAGKPAGSISAAKYRSADGKEWTGRGRKPAWVLEHLKKGGKLEDLAI